VSSAFPVPSGISEERRGSCVDCGAVLYVDADERFDVALHDCRTDEWTLLALRVPDEDAEQ
jgi:hypothetical protein